ncbi:acylphosphatase [Sinimarinibacterium sp. CAU 1509]|uniref:acylphosphatase n=1 Tax=Sinimarinibacterium sp. CAU 1509 TaxID=2562283 RepID=UPI0010ABEA0A|nr:acylphosphatase [Sinimarinibacterium sp. CAU 1509]TJY64733.1 acylphosphatase [Sinimarinibacterium sp. CAU 1509]
MAASYRFIVSGRVQGVFFRQSTIAAARELGLDGWVMNRTDGRVEGVASGAEAGLQTLREWLRHGPPQARVESLEWLACEEAPPRGFHLRASA